jgi:methionine synthase / methylenetetrahydrofolate reductase(NADPH)
MNDFRQFIQEDRVRVFDGAMGTMLYAAGVYINRSYDELNLSAPDTVRGIHAEYVKAGAEIIETNTYGASRLKLAQHGLDDRLAEVNVAAARLARKAVESARHDAFVAGAISPLGVRIEPYGPTSAEEAKALFKEQGLALLEGGVDCFVLETFDDLAEAHQAILALREISSLPVFIQMTINEAGTTTYGTDPEIFTAMLDRWGADVIGLNCSVGPQIILSAIERMRAITERKLVAQPNAGMPRDVHGRQIYMCSPEYMARYAKRLIQVGAKFVGGCCGTTPEHRSEQNSPPGQKFPSQFVEADFEGSRGFRHVLIVTGEVDLLSTFAEEYDR